MIMMKRLSFLLICLSVSFCAFSQKNEFGGGLSAYNYTGDMSRFVSPLQTRPGGMLFYRWNFHSFLALRNNLEVGFLSGNDNNPIDALAENRDFSFTTGLFQVSSRLEYNFFDYTSRNSLYDWSPYLYAGIGMVYLFGQQPQPNNESFSNFQLNMPFGGGIKKRIGKVFWISGELTFNRAFTDYLDNISAGIQSEKNYLFGNSFNDDWFYQFSITFSYVLYVIPCPFHYN